MKNLILTSILTCSAAFAQGYWSDPVKLPEVINHTPMSDSFGNHYHARISPDGKELYYTIDVYAHFDDIFVARYNQETEEWDSVTRLSVNMDDIRRELSPSITADHSKLFWTAWERPGGYGAYDVWYAEWDSVKGDWGEPQNAGPNVNTIGYEFTCFIAPDGKTLYASSWYDADGEDIFKHTWQDTGWGPREQVFEKMTMPGDQYAPWVSADGKWMYFTRIRVVEHGRSTYRSRWEGEYFGEPEWLDYPVCLTGRYAFNDCPSLTPDGARLYFASNRPDSNYQGQYIWYSDYINTVEEDSLRQALDFTVAGVSENEVTVRYNLPQSMHVFCGVYDTAGGLVRILASETQQGGEHTL
ncbi:PD40 domain-containing protein, partial [candidate division WOR-3 bacterium]|nr:PD40 domain-containing protein [candidate division WOR-3 bacterium]